MVWIMTKKCRSLPLGVKSDRFVASSVMLGLVSESFTFPPSEEIYTIFFESWYLKLVSSPVFMKTLILKSI